MTAFSARGTSLALCDRWCLAVYVVLGARRQSVLEFRALCESTLTNIRTRRIVQGCSISLVSRSLAGLTERPWFALQYMMAAVGSKLSVFPSSDPGHHLSCLPCQGSVSEELAVLMGRNPPVCGKQYNPLDLRPD